MQEKEPTKNLTKGELQMMNILWDLGKASVHDIMDRLPDPKPAYTTALTMMQVLPRKGVVVPERRGKMHIFQPILTRDAYIDHFMEDTRKNIFKGSMRSFLSYFAKSEKISNEELQEIIQEINSDKQQ